MVIVMAKEKGMAGMEKGMVGMDMVGMEKGMAGMEKGMEKEKGNHQVMVLMTWKATLMGIRIRDNNYV